MSLKNGCIYIFRKMAEVKHIVLDTSVFTNPACYHKYGTNTPLKAIKKVLRHFSERAKGAVSGQQSLEQKKEVKLYMTPGCLAELKTFVELDHVSPSLLVTLNIKNPNRDRVKVSGAFVYELVTEFRRRGDESLKYACKKVKDAYKAVPQQRVKGQPDPVAKHIATLRDGFRNHTRTNFIDSGADLDTLLLAKELKAKIVTGDLGMEGWAHRLGIEWLDVRLLLAL